MIVPKYTKRKEMIKKTSVTTYFVHSRQWPTLLPYLYPAPDSDSQVASVSIVESPIEQLRMHPVNPGICLHKHPD